MKTWTMPKVAVDAFRANEYVSACNDYVVSTVDFRSTYFDWDKDGRYDGDTEEITNTTGSNRYTVGQWDELGVGWFPNVTVYKDASWRTPSTGELYSNTRYFQSVGTYNIYVYDNGHHASKAVVYNTGFTPSGEPTDDKAFS